jgi:hypothetical protein
MKVLLTMVTIAAVLVFLVPETEAKIDKGGLVYRGRSSRAYVGSYGTGGHKIYSSSPAIR